MAKRNLQSSTLMHSKLLGDDDQDPMGSMGNLMDVMLVFACGLIIALIANWNVDLTSQSAPAASPNIMELEGDFQEVEDGVSEGIEGFTQVGSVFTNDETGEMYVVTNTPEESGDAQAGSE